MSVSSPHLILRERHRDNWAITPTEIARMHISGHRKDQMVIEGELRFGVATSGAPDCKQTKVRATIRHHRRQQG